MGKDDIVSFIFDARGNGGGEISPTITGDHQNRITDYTAIVLQTAPFDNGIGKDFENVERNQRRCGRNA